MQSIFYPGAKCTVNGNGDLCFHAESRTFIDQTCTIIKVTKAGFVEVSLDSNPKKRMSFAKDNITVTNIDNLIWSSTAAQLWEIYNQKKYMTEELEKEVERRWLDEKETETLISMGR